jgi:folate-binding protein YgfZ
MFAATPHALLATFGLKPDILAGPTNQPIASELNSSARTMRMFTVQHNRPFRLILCWKRIGEPLYNRDAVWRDDQKVICLHRPKKSSPMTDTSLAAITPATPLATVLESSATPPAQAAYRGVLTPPVLDAPATEIAALTQGAAVHDLGWLRRVAVRGEDRFRWLGGMVTNMVAELAPNAGAWNLVLNAQGRIQGDLHVWREDDQLELVIAADQYEKLIAHLEHFIVMDDVELATLEGESALGLTGPKADDVLTRMSLPTLAEPFTSTRVEWNGFDLRIVRAYCALVPHYELWTAAAGISRLWKSLRTAGAIRVGTTSLEAFRIAEGIPVYGVDMAERDLPQETSQLRALHFNKGCYLGQEIVERIRSRGAVHRHLRSLELDGPLPEPGTELTLNGAPAGQITSAATLQLPSGNRTFAMAMIRGEAEIGNKPLSYAAGAATGAAQILAAPPELR